MRYELVVSAGGAIDKRHVDDSHVYAIPLRKDYPVEKDADIVWIHYYLWSKGALTFFDPHIGVWADERVRIVLVDRQFLDRYPIATKNDIRYAIQAARRKRGL